MTKKLLKPTLLASIFCTLIGSASLYLPNQSAYALNAAIVNGEAIPLGYLDFQEQQERDMMSVNTLQNGPTQAPLPNLVNRADVLKKIIKDAVIASTARKLHLDQHIDYVTDAYIQERVLAARFLQESIIEQLKKNLQTEINRQVSQEQANAKEYLIRQIVVADESTAKNIIEGIHQGKSFDTLLAQTIEPHGKERKGRLPWLRPTQLLPELSQALPNLSIQKISPQPIQTKFGWHVLLLEDSRNISLAQLTKEITDNILNPQIKPTFDALLKTLETNTKSVNIPEPIQQHLIKRFENKKTTAELQKELQLLEKIYQEAKQRGVLLQANNEYIVQQRKQQLLIRMYRTYFQSTFIKTIDEQTLRKSYEQFVQQLKQSPKQQEYQLKQYTFATEAEAKTALKALQTQNQTDNTYQANLIMSSQADEYLSLDLLPPTIGSVLVTLPKGKFYASPIQMASGWALVQLLDSREKQPLIPSFDAFKQSKIPNLAETAYTEHIEKLVKQARIE